jgi:hypothetical protein
MPKRKLGLVDNQGPVSGGLRRSRPEREDDDSQEHYHAAAANMFSRDDYTVGWICALPNEMAAAKAMLDDIHTDLPVHPSDHNTYTLGRIGNHKIAIACLPSGVYGTASATTVATQMLSSFGQYDLA